MERTRAATPPTPPQPETVARLMRRIHDGTGMGTFWQVIIFIGGIIPAVLAVTGIMMWLNMRYKRVKGRQLAGLEALTPEAVS